MIVLALVELKRRGREETTMNRNLIWKETHGRGERGAVPTRPTSLTRWRSGTPAFFASFGWSGCELAMQLDGRVVTLNRGRRGSRRLRRRSSSAKRVPRRKICLAPAGPGGLVRAGDATKRVSGDQIGLM